MQNATIHNPLEASGYTARKFLYFENSETWILLREIWEAVQVGTAPAGGDGLVTELQSCRRICAIII